MSEFVCVCVYFDSWGSNSSVFSMHTLVTGSF